MTLRSIAFASLFAATLLTLAGGGVTRAEPAPTTQPRASAYPLDVCVISGHKLGGEMGAAVVETIDGREVHFCCADCVEAFKKDTVSSNKKMDEMIVAKLKPTYPLTECPVAGEPLGSMGDPVMYVDPASNRLIQLCCKGCVKTVKKDPSAALAKIDAAQKAAESGR